MSSKYLLSAMLKLLLAWFLLYSVAPTISYAATAEEEDIKAAFIYNFTQFTSWPQQKTNTTLCVLGDGVYYDKLEKYQGRIINTSILEVQQIYRVEEVRSCDMLFINKSAHGQIDYIHKTLEGLPVLTVAEYGVADPPGVMVLLVREANRVSFEINQQYAARANISLSYKLLKLARKVKQG